MLKLIIACEEVTWIELVAGSTVRNVTPSNSLTTENFYTG